jgi:phytoene dehydrogenase-like protein
VFYWGLKKTFPDLGLHNIFFSEDYQREFADLRDGHLPADPTVYVNITSKMEASHAPEGCENWFVLVNAPAASLDVGALREAVVEKVSQALKVDIASLIVSEDILDPAGIDAQTRSYLGALYGTASNNPMAAFNRHPNQSKKYPGLYLCGGTVHPGGGIPLCLRSGRLAADAVKSKS